MDGQRNPDIQRLLANLRNGGLQSDFKEGGEYSRNEHIASQNLVEHKLRGGPTPSLGPESSEERETSSILPPQRNASETGPSSSHLEQPHGRAITPTVPDASAITTWPAALKHITRHVVSNEKAASKIKHLISEQHKHERQWWAGREAIMARHSGRADNQAKVADLLKSLGGASVPATQHDPEADEAELEAYDKKVYKSLTNMAADFDRQLKSLQIPFFAIKHELVILDDGIQKGDTTQGKLDKGELRELQRRTIETLQDLLGDD